MIIVREKLNEIRRNSAAVQSMGMGYSAIIVKVLSKVPLYMYAPGRKFATDEYSSEETDAISRVIMEKFMCERKNLDVFELEDDALAREIVESLRKFLPDEPDVETIELNLSTYEIRFGRHFAIIKEENTTIDSHLNNPNFSVAVDNRYIKIRA